jgi:hypothetical protein
MVLGAFGTILEEPTLVAEATMQPGGMEIGEIERLAQLHGLSAEIRSATLDEIREIMAGDGLAIVYLNRRIFSIRNLRNLRTSIRESIIHCVVPIRITSREVIYHDPLLDEPQRASRQRFEAAFAHLDHRCIPCRPAQAST